MNTTKRTTYRENEEIRLTDKSGVSKWYTVSYFKPKEETKMEEKECLFKNGQVVWDVAFGKGVVRSITNRNDPDRPITVDFNGDLLHYTRDGAYSKQRHRTLYFSEPKIEAATEPLFEPTLEAGMVVVALDKETSRFYPMVVREETEEHVTSAYGAVFNKKRNDFFRVGEKIEFN